MSKQRFPNFYTSLKENDTSIFSISFKENEVDNPELQEICSMRKKIRT